MIFGIVGMVVGVIGVVFGISCYLNTRKWAKQCKDTRIVIAYKQRVRLNAPIVEWLTWANLLNKDETSTGRVIFREGKTSVAIIRPEKRKDMSAYARAEKNAQGRERKKEAARG